MTTVATTVGSRPLTHRTRAVACRASFKASSASWRTRVGKVNGGRSRGGETGTGTGTEPGAEVMTENTTGTIVLALRPVLCCGGALSDLCCRLHSLPPQHSRRDDRRGRDDRGRDYDRRGRDDPDRGRAYDRHDRAGMGQPPPPPKYVPPKAVMVAATPTIGGSVPADAETVRVTVSPETTISALADALMAAGMNPSIPSEFTSGFAVPKDQVDAATLAEEQAKNNIRVLRGKQVLERWMTLADYGMLGPHEINLNCEACETSQHKIVQRSKQIVFGKNTIGYERYSEYV
eukprot:COSAG05_NODE_5771_length_1093_cov_4.235887_1_plen_289_part_01